MIYRVSVCSDVSTRVAAGIVDTEVKVMNDVPYCVSVNTVKIEVGNKEVITRRSERTDSTRVLTDETVETDAIVVSNASPFD